MTLQDTIGTFKLSKDADNIVTLTMDDPAGSANTMSEAFQASLGQVADALEAELAELTDALELTTSAGSA